MPTNEPTTTKKPGFRRQLNPCVSAADGREALLHVVSDSAAATARDALGYARRAFALRSLAERCDDEALEEAGCEAAVAASQAAAAAPALNGLQMASKLALLVSEMLRDFDGYPHAVGLLALASSALADAVLQAEGPINLPDGALAGVPEKDGSAAAGDWVARWAAVQARDGNPLPRKFYQAAPPPTHTAPDAAR